MKKMNFFLIATLLLIGNSCGIPKSEYDKLLAENNQLKMDLEECKNGAEKIIAIIEKAYAEKNYSLAKENIQLLSEKHPESPKNQDYKQLLIKIESVEQEEAKQREIKAKEAQRLANLNNLGMWSVRYYVDEFGEPTKKGYVTNSSSISGSFSNTATEGSELNVDFLISTASDISIQLYEYAGNNPVKAYSDEEYRVSIQDKDGKRYSLIAINTSDRLRFDASSSWQVHSILLKGGAIKFRIVEVETTTTQYNFTIQNADYYDNAYKKLTNK